MTTVIRNTTVITGDAGRTVHYDAAVALDGDVIVGIGPTIQVLAAHPDAEQVPGAGKAVFPAWSTATPTSWPQWTGESWKTLSFPACCDFRPPHARC